MTRLSFSSLRVRLLLLVLLAVAPALGMILYTAREQRRLATLQVQHNMLQLSRLAASHQDDLIEGARQLLVTLARLPQVRGATPAACRALFADLLKQHQGYSNLGVITPNGDVVCSGLPLRGPTNLADRAYFRRALETRDIAIGEYQIGRITGKATVNFGYPVLDEAGRTQAVVFAALDLAWLNQFARQAQLPLGTSLIVIDRTGTILVAYPDSEKWVGQSAAEAPFIKIILTQHEGAIEAPGLDGVPAVHGFTPLDGTPGSGYVYVSISNLRKLAFADANRVLVRNLTWLGLVTLLISVTAWVGANVFLLRPVNALGRAADRLAAGDLASRVQVTRADELGALASAFNVMADRLQAALGQLAAQIKDLERHQREISLLREIDQKLLAEVSLPELLQAAVEAFAQLAQAQICILATADPESGILQPVAIAAPEPEEVRRYFAEVQPRVGQGDLGLAIATSAAVLSPDIDREPRWDRLREPLVAHGIRLRAVLALPLWTDKPIPGVVALGYAEPRTFPEAEVQALQGFAHQVAVACEQVRLREEAAERWRLEEANRVKALFVANASHELRSPLTSIIGFSQLLEDETSGPLSEKQQRFVRNIYKSGQHLLALINDILDLSKVEAGKIELRPELLLLPDALESAVTLLRGQALKKGLTVEVQIEEGLPPLLADPVRVNQVLFNLLSNAIKFTPDGGTITVIARRRTGEVVELAVRDTGIGIKPEDLPKLFQEFVRLDTARAGRAEGTGLGLALTKRLVELHGGQIWAESNGEGRGSTFTVHLPLGAPSEARRG